MTQLTSTRRRWFQATALLGLSVMVLTGCRMQLNYTLKADDTVDGTIIMAMTTAEAAGLEAMGASVDDMVAEATKEMPENLPGATVEDYNQDGQTGKQLVFKNVPLSKFDGDEDNSLASTIKFSRDGNDFVVAGTLDMSGEDMAAASVVGSALDFTMSITFPGKVTETNGKTSGNTVTWKLEIGKTNEIQARGSANPSSAGSGYLIPVIAIVGVAVIALVVVLALRGRKKPPATVAEPIPGYPGQPPAVPGQQNPFIPPVAGPISGGPISGVGQAPVPNAPTPVDAAGQYGAPTTAAAWQPCPQCGTPNPPTSKYCGSCGQPTVTAPPPIPPVVPTPPAPLAEQPIAPIPPTPPVPPVAQPTTAVQPTQEAQSAHEAPAAPEEVQVTPEAQPVQEVPAAPSELPPAQSTEP